MQQAASNPTAGRPATSSQAGYMPIPLRYAPARAFRGIAVYLRSEAADVDAGGELFTLYRAANLPFTPDDRQRLLQSLKHVYVRIADHARFRAQAETSITEAVNDPTRAVSEKSALVYETSLELVNELLAEPDVTAHSARIGSVSRAVTTIVLSSPDAFQHLFSASHHDFYTATHLVNVATWMVSLAYELGISDPGDLSRVCQAGMLHDIGKIFVSPDLLNKPGRLTNDEWKQLQRHPVLGWEHLRRTEGLPTVVLDVCRQHHERLDGSGYPDRLKGDFIHRISRICAVVDAFDAMTALRPFKQKTMSVSEAILAIRADTPAKFDPEVVDAWVRLVNRVNDRDLTAKTSQAEQAAKDKRRFQRFPCDCPARIHLLLPVPGGGWQEEPGVMVHVKDVSRFGLGLRVGQPLEPGRHIRVYMHAKSTRDRPGKRIHGVVARCVFLDDGEFLVGLELYPAGPDANEN